MDTWILFFKQGLAHILDTDGLDHILFILAITVFFSSKEWKKLLWLITAFTVGHSITLILSVFEVLVIDRNLIEQLIPITIIITCVNNFIKVYKPKQVNYWLLYGMVLLFGCIHGLAFSNFLKMSLFENESLVSALFGFNIGIEVGQLIIVTLFLGVVYVLQKVIKQLLHKHIVLACTTVVLCMAIKILIEVL